MPLNYNKWDALELSDDSDIETHPNIDTKSMIRWKQQDIHQKRMERQARIAKYNAEADLNDVLRPRITSLVSSLSTLPTPDALSTYSSLVSQLRISPSPDKPKTNAPNQPTYDVMLLHLLEQVQKEATEAVSGDKDKERLSSKLHERLSFHLGKLDERTEECRREAKNEEAEANKKITSDGMKEGFSSGYVNKAGENPLLDEKKKAPAKKEPQFEVLNPGATASSSTSAPSAVAAPAPSTDDDDDEELPKATNDVLDFVKIRYLDFDAALLFIQSHPLVMAEGTTDSLLIESFNSEMEGKKDLARRCVEKGLLVQYCRKLGRDGVRLFFQRMRLPGDPGKRALRLFLDDVESTYDRIAKRVVEMAAESAARKESGEGVEQIQLVAEGGATISFNVPQGPPPETIELQGEGTEDLDPVEVRAWLLRQWDLFDSFSEPMKKALRAESLDQVNKVLGKMSVEEAEQIVGAMNEANILNFNGDGIRDETGR